MTNDATENEKVVSMAIDAKELRTRVFDNLNSAIEGGYTEILSWPNSDIALDLLAFAEDLSEVTPEEIEPYINEWRIERESVVKDQ